MRVMDGQVADVGAAQDEPDRRLHVIRRCRRLESNSERRLPMREIASAGELDAAQLGSRDAIWRAREQRVLAAAIESLLLYEHRHVKQLRPPPLQGPDHEM